MIWLVAQLALAGPPTMAIVSFDNNTGDVAFDALGTGIQDMLVSDLAHVDGLQLVERERIQQVLDELSLTNSGFVDPKTAAQMGKGVGAKWVLAGGISAVAPMMRIDARVIDVRTSKIVATAETTGPQDEFFLLEKELAVALLDELDIQTSARMSARMGRVQTENFDAFLAYSEGLEALDAGEVDEASRRLRDALAHDADFASAESVLTALQGRLADLRDERVDLFDAEARRVLDELDRIEATDDWPALQELVETQNNRSGGMSVGERHAIARKVLDVGAPEELRVNDEWLNAQGVNEWAIRERVRTAFWAGYREDVLTWGETFLERYPTSNSAQGVQSSISDVLASIEEERSGEAERALSEASAFISARRWRCRSGIHGPSRVDLCRAYIHRADQHGLVEEGDVEEWIEAAEDAHDDALLAEAQEWARDHDFHDQVKGAERAREELAKARARYDSTDFESKLGEAERALDYAVLVSIAVDVGDHELAVAVLRKGVADLPHEESLWKRGWGIARLRFDRDLAAEFVDGAKDAGHAAHHGDETLVKIDKGLLELAEIPARELHDRALVFERTGLHGDAAATYLELADLYPDFGRCSAPCALDRAGQEYRRALVPDRHLLVRRAWERLVADHPESEEARRAKRVLPQLRR